MHKEKILPALAVAGGLVGGLLRTWERATAFEPDSGLAIPGAPATWALIGVSAAMVLLLLFLCRKSTRPLEGYDSAFCAKGNTLYLVCMVAAAFLMAASGALSAIEFPAAYQAALAARQGANPMLGLLPRVLLTCLSFATGWCLFTLGRDNYRGEGRGKYNVYLLVPAYTACVWLIVSYQSRSGDPVVLDYVWQLFAIIACVLGSYFMAGFAFERAKTFGASWMLLCSVYFCLVALADRHNPAMTLLYAGFAVYLLASAATLIFNANRPEGAAVHKSEPNADEEEPTHDQ